MTEAEWQRQVLDLARTLGWRSMHVRKAIGHRAGAHAYQTPTSIDGWPDLFLWHVYRPERGCVAIELKSEKGVVTDQQQRVLDELRASGVRTMVARPSDVDALVALLRT